MQVEKLWFIITRKGLLLKGSPEAPALPRAAAPPLPLSGEIIDLGEHGGLPCRAAMAACEAPEGFFELGLRELPAVMGNEIYNLAGRAAELAYWQQNSRFCPACGSATALHHSAIAKACPACGKMLFPKPTAAVLALVEKGDSLLLVRAHNFQGPFYGLVAGYLEAGESLEDCVRREVMEETGLSIKNIRYFGSQPWPFPNTLMVGYTAEYAGGEIRLQEEELAEAAWFTRADMPALPNKISLTRSMIDWWVNKK